MILIVFEEMEYEKNTYWLGPILFITFSPFKRLISLDLIR